jgi:hypothetical protein
MPERLAACRPQQEVQAEAFQRARAPRAQGTMISNRRRLDNLGKPPGDVAEWLRSGLQSRLHRFDSGRRLYASSLQIGGFW